MISKELLSVVLGLHCGIKSIKNSEVIYWFDCIGEIREHSINIYELAHKCKEWAIKYSGWTLQSYTNERGSGVCRIKVGDGQEINKLIASSEPEAIFKACEWILNKELA